VLIGQKQLPESTQKELLSLINKGDLFSADIAVFALKHPDPAVSEVAAGRLANGGTQQDEGIVEAFTHPDAHVRRNAITALGTYRLLSDSILNSLADLLKDPDVTVRRAAILALMRHRKFKLELPDHISKQVGEAVKDVDDEVRLGAIIFLIEQGG